MTEQPQEQPKAPFAYKERIIVSPSPNTAQVRLETSASLELSRNDENELVIPPTPFPSIVSDFLQRFQASRILIQTGSEASSNVLNGDDDTMPPPWNSGTTDSTCSADSKQYSNYGTDGIRSNIGPSGVSVVVQFISNESESELRQSFKSILVELAEQRIVLASLDSISFQRLHRWIHVSRSSDREWTFQVMLPVEAAPMSAEGVAAFMESSICPKNSGVFGTSSDTAISNVLMGSTPGISSSIRRSTWIDLESSCHDHLLKGTSYCHMHVHQGIQYGVRLDATREIPLSRLLPGGLHDSSNSIFMRTCPVADSTTLHIMHPGNEEKRVVLENGLSLKDVAVPIPMLRQQWQSPLASIQSTILRPRGVANTGTLVTVVENNHDTCGVVANVTIVVQSTVMRPLWRTLQMHPVAKQGDSCGNWHDATLQHLNATVHHELVFEDDGSAVMHLGTFLQPNSCLVTSLEYNPKFLAFEQFPGDPNRGIELSPPIAMLAWEQGCTSLPVQLLYSNMLLLMPPVPDMSMPFNVLSLTCTLYAFLFGTMLNLLLRKSSEKIQCTCQGKEPPKSRFQLLKEKIKARIQALRKGKSVTKEGEHDNVDETKKESVIEEDETKKESVIEEEKPATAKGASEESKHSE